MKKEEENISDEKKKRTEKFPPLSHPDPLKSLGLSGGVSLCDQLA